MHFLPPICCAPASVPFCVILQATPRRCPTFRVVIHIIAFTASHCGTPSYLYYPHPSCPFPQAHFKFYVRRACLYNAHHLTAFSSADCQGQSFRPLYFSPRATTPVQIRFCCCHLPIDRTSQHPDASHKAFPRESPTSASPNCAQLHTKTLTYFPPLDMSATGDIYRRAPVRHATLAHFLERYPSMESREKCS